MRRILSLGSTCKPPTDRRELTARAQLTKSVRRSERAPALRAALNPVALRSAKTRAKQTRSTQRALAISRHRQKTGVQQFGPTIDRQLHVASALREPAAKHRRTLMRETGFPAPSPLPWLRRPSAPQRIVNQTPARRTRSNKTPAPAPSIRQSELT